MQGSICFCIMYFAVTPMRLRLNSNLLYLTSKHQLETNILVSNRIIIENAEIVALYRLTKSTAL